MKPIHFTIGDKRPVMIIPDTQAHLDGHTVLTYNYNVYNDNGFEDAKIITSKENELHLDHKKDPSYLGFVTFEQPGKLFTYTADGQGELSSNEVQEIIENITHYRDHPGMWQLSGD